MKKLIFVWIAGATLLGCMAVYDAVRGEQWNAEFISSIESLNNFSYAAGYDLGYQDSDIHHAKNTLKKAFKITL